MGRRCASPVATILEQVNQAVGLDKLTVLAVAVDQVQQSMRTLAPLDEQLELLDMLDLAKQHGVSFKTLRAQVASLVGPGSVFRLGKRWVIRKQRFLEFLQAQERLEE